MAAPNNIPISLSLEAKQFLQQVQAAATQAQNQFGNITVRPKFIMPRGGFGGSGPNGLGSFNQGLSNLEKSFEAATSRVIAFTATTSLIYGFGNALQRLTKDAIEVEAAMARISSISNLTGGGLKTLQSQLFGIANTTGVAFGKAAETYEEFARQGLSVQKSLQGVNAVLGLVKLAGGDITSTIGGITAVMNAFTNEALDIDKVANSLSALDAAFSTTSTGLIDGLSRFSGVASDAGLTAAEAAAALTALKTTTGLAERNLGNSLKSILTGLQSERVQGVLEGIGVATRDATGAFRSQIDVITDVANKFTTLSDSVRASTAEAIAGKYQINAFQGLLRSFQGGEGSIFNRALQVQEGSEGDIAKRLATVTDTAEAELNRLQNAITQVGGSLSENLIRPLVSGFTGIFTPVLETLSKEVSTDTSLGDAIISGISSVITGPGVAAIGLAFFKVIGKLGEGLTKGLSALNNFTAKGEQNRAIQQAITAAMQQGDKALIAQVQASTNLQQRQVAINALLSTYITGLKESARITKSLPGLVSPTVRGAITNPKGYADGFLPAVNKERLAIARGVGGASASAKPALAYVNLGRGKEPAIVNTDETIVRNFGGSGKDAILTPNMVAGNFAAGDFGNIGDRFPGLVPTTFQNPNAFQKRILENLKEQSKIEERVTRQAKLREAIERNRTRNLQTSADKEQKIVKDLNQKYNLREYLNANVREAGNIISSEYNKIEIEKLKKINEAAIKRLGEEAKRAYTLRDAIDTPNGFQIESLKEINARYLDGRKAERLLKYNEILYPPTNTPKTSRFNPFNRQRTPLSPEELDKRQQRRQQGVLGASVALPFVTGSLANQAESGKTRGIIEGIGEGVGSALLGASFGPKGAIIGGVVGSFQIVSSVGKALGSDFEDINKQTEKYLSVLNNQIGVTSSYTSALQALNTAVATGASEDVVKRLSRDVSSEERRLVSSAVDLGNSRDISKFIGNARATKNPTELVEFQEKLQENLERQGSIKNFRNSVEGFAAQNYSGIAGILKSIGIERNIEGTTRNFKSADQYVREGDIVSATIESLDSGIERIFGTRPSEVVRDTVGAGDVSAKGFSETLKGITSTIDFSNKSVVKAIEEGRYRDAVAGSGSGEALNKLIADFNATSKRTDYLLSRLLTNENNRRTANQEDEKKRQAEARKNEKNNLDVSTAAERYREAIVETFQGVEAFRRNTEAQTSLNIASLNLKGLNLTPENRIAAESNLERQAIGLRSNQKRNLIEGDFQQTLLDQALKASGFDKQNAALEVVNKYRSGQGNEEYLEKELTNILGKEAEAGRKLIKAKSERSNALARLRIEDEAELRESAARTAAAQRERRQQQLSNLFGGVDNDPSALISKVNQGNIYAEQQRRLSSGQLLPDEIKRQNQFQSALRGSPEGIFGAIFGKVQEQFERSGGVLEGFKSRESLGIPSRASDSFDISRASRDRIESQRIMTGLPELQELIRKATTDSTGRLDTNTLINRGLDNTSVRNIATSFEQGNLTALQKEIGEIAPNLRAGFEQFLKEQSTILENSQAAIAQLTSQILKDDSIGPVQQKKEEKSSDDEFFTRLTTVLKQNQTELKAQIDNNFKIEVDVSGDVAFAEELKTEMKRVATEVYTKHRKEETGKTPALAPSR